VVDFNGSARIKRLSRSTIDSRSMPTEWRCRSVGSSARIAAHHSTRPPESGKVVQSLHLARGGIRAASRAALWHHFPPPDHGNRHHITGTDPRPCHRVLAHRTAAHRDLHGNRKWRRTCPLDHLEEGMRGRDRRHDSVLKELLLATCPKTATRGANRRALQKGSRIGHVDSEAWHAAQSITVIGRAP
jgi:hypothetical protein